MIENDLVSALLQDPERLDEVLDIVDSADFGDMVLKTIFNEMKRLQKYDFNIIRNNLREKDREAYDRCLKVFDIGFPKSATDYARQVKEASKKRNIIEIAEKLKTLTGTTMSAQELAEMANEDLLSLYDKSQKDFRSGREVAISYIERLAMLKEKKLDISGLTTGFRVLDLATDGMKSSELVIIGARPSQGKTSLMTQIAYHQAVECKKCVAIFSIESPDLVIYDKMISQKTRIDTRKLRTGDCTNDEYDLIMMYSDNIAGANFYIYDVSSINIHKVRVMVKRLISRGKKPDIILLDYLQIVELDKGHDTKASKVGRVAQGLKNIAKELQIPVVALAQLNRGVEDSSPTLYSLKESGDIEQIADQVWLLHREEFYKKKNCKEENKGKIDIDIAKNREGQTVLVKLNWEGQCTRIYE